MIKVVFFDVDGTILSHTKNIVTPVMLSAFEKLKKNNIRCVLATGRHMLELALLPVRDLEFDGYITINGQLCLDDQKQIYYGSPITGTGKKNLLRLFEEKAFPIILVESDRMYINFVNEHVKAVQDAIFTAVPPVGVYTGGEIYLSSIFVDATREQQLREALADCRMIRWHEGAVDIISPTGDKTAGISQYLKKYHIEPHETMAFGDGENDIEMLRFAGIGVAMGNADNRVKQSADYITASVDDDGVEKALRHFGLL